MVSVRAATSREMTTGSGIMRDLERNLRLEMDSAVHAFARAMVLAKKLSRKSSTSTASTLGVFVEMALRRREIDSALGVSRRLAQHHPSRTTLSQLAECLRLKGRKAEAKRVALRAKRFAPSVTERQAERDLRSATRLKGLKAPGVLMIEREIELVRPDEVTTAVHLGIGFPKRERGGDWACDVSARGLYKRLAPVRGVDAFQSLTLAIELLRTLISSEIERGSTLKAFGEETTVAALFGFGGSL